MTIAEELDQLLAIGAGDVADRERDMVANLALADGDPFVLFGAGSLGRQILARLRQIGVEPAAFADNNPALWGREVDGLHVLSAMDAVREFGRDTPFFVTIYNSRAPRQQLRKMGIRTVPSPVLAMRFPDALLPLGCIDRPSRLIAKSAMVRDGLSAWSDDMSCREYVDQIRYRLTFEEVPPGLPSGDIYFPNDLVVPAANEFFVDCGAYDGDSIREFLRRRDSQFGQIVALEPDPANCAKLHASLADCPSSVRDRIDVIPAAVGAWAGTAWFDASGTAGSAVTPNGGVEVEVVALDDVFCDRSASYIKMDVEGHESMALDGARQVIGRDDPVLAICLYHRSSDLWKIPLQIRAINDRYRFFLRRYGDDCWEQVCYAVPPSRLRA